MAAETGLTKADDSALAKCAKRIEDGKSDMLTGGLAIGEALAEAHAILSQPGCNGRFKPWVEKECGFSISSAKRYIGAFERFGANRSICGPIQDTAMYLLAPNDLASQKAIQLAKIGKPVSVEKAKELLKEFKQKAAAKPPSKPKPATEKVAPLAKPHEDETEPEPEGGWEPSEAKKPLDKLHKALCEAARAYGDVKKILGESGQLDLVFCGIDEASKALDKFRKAFKRRAK